MSTEPERNIEKQLKAYAEKRRTEAGAPFEMHPATRNLLQAEVAREIPKRLPRQGSFLSQLLAVLWPRVAWGVSLFVVLMIGTWMFWPTEHKSNARPELAQQIPGAQPTDEIAVSTDTPKPAMAAPPAEPLSLAAAPANALSQVENDTAERAFDKGLAGRSDKSQSGVFEQRYGLKPSAAAPQLADANKPASPDAPSDRLSLQPSVALAETETAPPRSAAPQLSTTRAKSPVPTSSARPAAAPARSFAVAKEAIRSNSDGTGVASSTQRFAQVEVAAKKTYVAVAPARNAILTSFRMEQSGNQVMVIDRDGSTYAGFLQVADASSRPQNAEGKDSTANRERKTKTAAKVEVFKTGVNSELQAEQDYFFRVEGTNRSLNQRVVFSGHLLANGSNAGAYKTNVTTTATGQLQSPLPNPLPPLLLDSRINGTALIGGSNALEIQALPVKP